VKFSSPQQTWKGPWEKSPHGLRRPVLQDCTRGILKTRIESRRVLLFSAHSGSKQCLCTGFKIAFAKWADASPFFMGRVLASDSIWKAASQPSFSRCRLGHRQSRFGPSAAKWTGRAVSLRANIRRHSFTERSGYAAGHPDPWPAQLLHRLLPHPGHWAHRFQTRPHPNCCDQPTGYVVHARDSHSTPR